MTATLLLRFDGPMQAWGVAAFNDRPVMPFPTKSGIVGLLANALGRDRVDSIDDLVRLFMAVRADEAGSPMTDFQTAGRDGWRSADGRLHTDNCKIRRKGYLSDAVFTVALTGDTKVVELCANAVARPARPVFLGRRCCPPAAPLLIGISSLPSLSALLSVPYQGHRLTPPDRFLIAVDSVTGEQWDDLPVSFAPGRREHASRAVTVMEITAAGPEPAQARNAIAALAIPEQSMPSAQP